MKKHTIEDVPMNANERFLYAIINRQEIIIEQLNSIIEHIAKQDNVAVEETIAVDEVKVEEAPKRRTRKKVE